MLLLQALVSTRDGMVRWFTKTEMYYNSLYDSTPTDFRLLFQIRPCWQAGKSIPIPFSDNWIKASCTNLKSMPNLYRSYGKFPFGRTLN